jgi:copper(I)-binding protein
MKTLVMTILLFGTATAAEGGGIVVEHPWARPSIGASSNGVVYMTITDQGAADELTGVTTPIADSAMLHQTTAENGVSQMRMIDTLPISAGGTATLSPGGYHLMLTGLHQKLTVGDTFPLTLHFAHAGDVPVTVTVEPLGAGK